jgi:hypothetical protein
MREIRSEGIFHIDHLGEISRSRHGWWISARLTEIDVEGASPPIPVTVFVAALSGSQRWTRLTAALEARRLR